jgi:hypothetical protein
VEKLLVTMTGHASIEKLMPCLELLARPGMTVIFAFPYPVESSSYSRDHRITVESAIHATAVGRKVVERYNWDAQREVARRIIAPAVGPLENKGLRVEIHVCASSLAKIIENYSVDKDVQWIVSELPRPGLIGQPKDWCPRAGPVIYWPCEPTEVFLGENASVILYRCGTDICFILFYRIKEFQ